ncbi:sugar MFS transporter [Chitinophaga lutea]
MANKSATVEVGSLSKRDTRISILIIGVLFFVFGFVSWVNAILIPYFKIGCELNSSQQYLVTLAFYISYLVISVPSSYLLKRVGFKKGMMIGFWVMAAGAFLFIPAALSRTYGVFLMGLFALGTGLAVLQSAANPYITILGPKESAAQRISIMGICNKGAGILAPIIFALVILRATDTDLFKELPTMAPAAKEAALDAFVRRVIGPYSVLGAVLFLLGLVVRYSPLPEINTDREDTVTAASNADKKTIFAFPHLILGAVAIFLHVGTQVIAIDTIIPYAQTMGLNLMEAKFFPGCTLAATIAGYLIGITLIPRFVSQVNALRFCTMLGAVLTLCIIYMHGHVQLFGHPADISIWFVVLLGLANSLVWAGIWPLALEGLGRFTKLGGSVLIMGLCGNAILPLIYGSFAVQHGERLAYWVLFPCYLYLIFYAFYGHLIRRWTPGASKDPAPIKRPVQEYEVSQDKN